MKIDIDAPAKTCHWCGKTIYPDIDRRCRSSDDGQYYYCSSECQREEHDGNIGRVLSSTPTPELAIGALLARHSRNKKIQKRMEEERGSPTESQVEKPKKKSCGCIVLIIILGLLILGYIL
jgi:hypothetical protein